MLLIKSSTLKTIATAVFCSGFVSLAAAFTAPLETRGDMVSDSSSWQTVQQSPATVDSEVIVSQQYISAGDTVTSSAAVAQQQAQPAYLSRLSQLETEVRELRGELEQQSHKLRQLISLQSKLFQDIDNRLDALVGHTVKPENVSANAASAQAEQPAAPTSRSPEAEQRAYQAAYSLLRTKQYAQAKHAMQNFIKSYPNGEYTVNAHYWLGELALLTGDNGLAATEFETVIKDYPASSKVSDAMLKVGLLYLEKGDTKLAKQQFQKLIKTFPNSASANIAHKRLQSL